MGNDEISSHRSYESNENEAVRSIQKSLISEYNKNRLNIMVKGNIKKEIVTSNVFKKKKKMNPVYRFSKLAFKDLK